MRICLIGIDGSGKTTQAKKIVSHFKEIGLDSTYYHPGRGRNALFKLPFVILYHKLLNKNLICDRGYYDTLVGLFGRNNNFIKIKKNILSLFISIYPKFNYVFLFNASFDTLVKRKNEIDKEGFESRMSLYEIIKARKESNTLDAEQNIDAVFNDIILKIKEGLL